MSLEKRSHSKEIYATSSIPDSEENGNEIFNSATNFMKEFKIEQLLFKCNAGKAKGIPVIEVFRYLHEDYYRCTDGYGYGIFPYPEQQLEEFTASFIQRLPKYIQKALEYGSASA